jgi:riboflavin synthase
VFTGIVEEVGTIVAAEPLEGGIAFRVGAVAILEGLRLGESIAIDGACHTVTAIHSDSFAIQSVATTLQRTTLGDYHVGHRVNLERALALGERLGGHLVQGHVDAVGAVLVIEKRGEHVLLDFTIPSIVAEVSILYGSITLNGVSLTINALPAPGQAQASIIPHTWEVTAIRDLKVGSAVNLEGDLIGKYVRRLMDRPAADSTASAAIEHLTQRQG